MKIWKKLNVRATLETVSTVAVASVSATSASAAITETTIDFDDAGTAIMGQVSSAMPVGLTVLGIILGIGVGIALFKRLAKGK